MLKIDIIYLSAAVYKKSHEKPSRRASQWNRREKKRRLSGICLRECFEHIIPCGSGNNNTDLPERVRGASAAEIFGIHIRDT
jgi:hypothetical protein